MGKMRRTPGAPGVPTTPLPAIDEKLVPRAFVATTVQRYALAVVSAATVIGEAEPVWLPPTPPFVDWQETPKEVIALPLSDAGVKNTLSGPVEPGALPGTTRVLV